MHTVGVADTTFATIDMAQYVLPVLKKAGVKIERYTVPGFKDLAVACKKLLEEYHCDTCIALGMAGRMPIDEQCAHTASQALKQVELMTNKHILEVFVFSRETKSSKKLVAIAKDRAEKHAENALKLLQNKTALTPFAGSGRREGGPDAGSLQ